MYLALGSYLITIESQVAFLVASPVQLQWPTKMITVMGASGYALVMFGVAIKSPYLFLFQLVVTMGGVYSATVTDNYLLNCYALTHADARVMLGKTTQDARRSGSAEASKHGLWRFSTRSPLPPRA